jgi:hypothetical protein
MLGIFLTTSRDHDLQQYPRRRLKHVLMNNGYFPEYIPVVDHCLINTMCKSTMTTEPRLLP